MADEFPSPVVDSEGRPSPLAVAALVGVGLLLLAHPLYLLPHAGQTAYALTDVDPVAGDVPPEELIAYRDLPPAARTAFDEARVSGSGTLWTGEDDAAITGLRNHEYVQYQGQQYRYRFVHTDHPRPFGELWRGILTALGSVFLVVGGLTGYAGRFRPLTPVRSLWLPVVAVLGLLATSAHDVWLSGASGSVGLPNSYVTLVPLAGVFLCVGSLVRRRGTDAFLPVGAVGVVLLGTGALVTGAPPVVPVIVGVASVVGGAPWFALGYWLTSPA